MRRRFPQACTWRSDDIARRATTSLCRRFLDEMLPAAQQSSPANITHLEAVIDGYCRDKPIKLTSLPGLFEVDTEGKWALEALYAALDYMRQFPASPTARWNAISTILCDVRYTWRLSIHDVAEHEVSWRWIDVGGSPDERSERRNAFEAMWLAGGCAQAYAFMGVELLHPD